MRGDILIITENHKKAASQCMPFILPEFKKANKPFIITVAGESGAGKSEIAECIAMEFENIGIKCFIFQQDDYFVYPPKSNTKKREEDIHHVGISEVRLDLLEEHCKAAYERKKIEKPLVIFEEDKIDTEVVDLSEYQGFIVEGTYTTALENVDIRVFIDRNYIDTKGARLKRSREKQDQFLEEILKIEHEIISKHKNRAHIIITKEYNVQKGGCYEK
jgi:uridine kinase